MSLNKLIEIGRMFQLDVRGHLHGEYLLEDGRVVFGNSTSYVRSWTRNMNESGRRWRNLGGDGQFEDLCERAGFKVLRGRGRRWTRSGTAWGVRCDVITECREVPCFLDTLSHDKSWLYYDPEDVCFDQRTEM